MKVYVENLPKKCEDCPCYHIDEMCSYCTLYAFDGNEIFERKADKQTHQNCPLLSLSDYTKQVRKEVCEEIGEQLGLRFDGKWQVVCDGCMTGDKTIMAVLDQIQGETEWK